MGRTQWVSYLPISATVYLDDLLRQSSFLTSFRSLLFLFKALLELDRPATLNKAVALVCLPKQGQSVSTGQYCTITGEGVRIAFHM